MSIRKNLEQVWAQLRSQAAVRKDSVTRVQIKNFRGIKDLQVRFPFPVCVLAGANSCGKSTVLFSLGCAYRVPDAPQMFTPQKLFPDFRPSHESDLADQHRGQVEIVFSYNVSGQSLEMLWKRGTNKWDKNFFGRKKSTQPERQVYLHIPEPVWAVGFALEQPLHVVALACSASRILKRLQHTLPKFSNPSEMRSTQKLAQRQYKLEVIDASNIAFAQRILGYEYLQLTLASSSGKDLLVAKRIDESEQDCQYSEYHMSSGERAVIRLSMHLSKLKDALVLIDEIDTGLHPYTQQLLMLELQRLALRNNLQIVCTTHSAVVLETVPEEARIFLERTGGNVFQKEAWRDTIQKSLYGRSQDVLTILCEDEEAEGLIRGIFDHLGPKIDILQNDIEIGRDTGKEQFLAHLNTLYQFKKLGDVIFILDGDADDVKVKMEARALEMNQRIKVFCVPGKCIPEQWVWNILRTKTAHYAQILGYSEGTLRKKMDQIDIIYSNAVDKPTAIVKHKLHQLLGESLRKPSDFFREIGRSEATTETGEMFDFVTKLNDAVRDWRSNNTSNSFV